MSSAKCFSSGERNGEVENGLKRLDGSHNISLLYMQAFFVGREIRTDTMNAEKYSGVTEEN